MIEAKVALVIAGGSGMGAAAARRLAADGFKVGILSSSGKGAALAQELGGIGVTGSNQSNEDIAQLVDAAIEQWGRIDVLVNSAGHGPRAPILDITDDEWHRGMEVYLLNVIRATRLVTPFMQKRQGGAIINIASVGAFLSYVPEAGQVVPYTTTKAAIVHLTQDLAAQWAAHGIRVNAIAPGSVESGMTDTLGEEVQQRLLSRILLRRFARPAEISGAVALLASEAGSFITGETLLVDGGQSIG